MRKIAGLALLCVTCSSSPKAVVVLALSYDSSVKNADQITKLQVTVDGVVRNYAVPSTAPFGNCTESASPPCTLEIDTSRTGQLGVTVVGTGESSDGGPSKVFGMGSGSAMAEAGKVQTVPIQLSCSSGTCGTVVVGTDGGAGTGGGGAGGARSDAGAGIGGVGAGAGGRGQAGGGAGAGGVAGATGLAGKGGTSGVGGTTGLAGSHGTGGGGMGGTSPAGGMTGAAGTTGPGGAGGIAGTGGGSGTGGTKAAGGMIGTGGTTGTAGAGGTSSAKNCIDAIKLNGYSATGAPPCTMCKSNQTDESAKCERTIDCEDAAYPCDSNCKLNCQNSQGDDSAVIGCVNSLLTAASCS